MRNKEKRITRARANERARECEEGGGRRRRMRKKDKTQLQDNFHGAARETGLCFVSLFFLPPFSLSRSVLERPRLRSHSHLTKDSLHHRRPCCALSSTVPSLFGVDRDIHEDIRPIEDVNNTLFASMLSQKLTLPKRNPIRSDAVYPYQFHFGSRQQFLD